jgi:hypothetical protein
MNVEDLQNVARERAALAPPRPSLTADRWRLGGLAAGAIVAVSAFLPWITVRAAFVGQLEARGIEGTSGIIALLVGLGVVAAFVWRKWPWTVVAAGLALAFAVEELVRIGHDLSKANDAMQGMGAVSLGFGLWVLVIGALGALIAALGRRS